MLMLSPPPLPSPAALPRDFSGGQDSWEAPRRPRVSAGLGIVLSAGGGHGASSLMEREGTKLLRQPAGSEQSSAMYQL